MLPRRLLNYVYIKYTINNFIVAETENDLSHDIWLTLIRILCLAILNIFVVDHLMFLG